MEKIIKILKNPKFLLYCFDRIGLIHINDEDYLKIQYEFVTGKKIDINFPQTFNEKLQWLKLNDRNDKYTQMVDKYEAKNYVSKLIGEDFIIPTIGVYEKFDDIDFNKLPNQFVIKCTHDSGGIVICKNKSELDIKKAKKFISNRLKKNFYWSGREYPYKNVKPRIIIEKYIGEGKSMRDYKFFCFNGVPKIMYLSEGLENHTTARMSFYDMNFKVTDCKRKDYKILNYIPSKPKTFEKMKKLAQILSKDIPHVRVDFYDVNNHIYFGELTFYTCSGLVPFEDEKWNKKMGDWISLPPNTNDSRKNKGVNL